VTQLYDGSAVRSVASRRGRLWSRGAMVKTGRVSPLHSL